MSHPADQYGMPNSSDILTAGRVIINGAHEKAAYETAENRAALGIVPFYSGPIDPIHRRVRDGEICLTRKATISSLGEVSRNPGYRIDGYPGSEHATGFSLLNGQGTGPQPGKDGSVGDSGDEWYQMVMMYKMAGVADQAAIFDQRGYDDDVDLTFQRRGLKTMRNNGPHTLHKGHLWMWEIPRNAEHARDIQRIVPRQDDTPKDRSTPYPREYDPLHDEVNTYLMHKILVQKINPSRLGDKYDCVEPIHLAIVNFDKYMRMCFALKEISDTQIIGGEGKVDYRSKVAEMSAAWADDQMTEYAKLRLILAKYGLISTASLSADEKNEYSKGLNQWGMFKYLLYAKEEGEHAMIAKLPSTATTLPTGLSDLRSLQENSISLMLGSIADGNQFARSRIGGTIENDSEPGHDFDTLLESN